MRNLIYFLYRSLQVLGFPLLLLYLLARILRDGRYGTHLAERFGFLPPTLEATSPGNIWLHAVSVGEVLSAVELLHRLRAQIPAAGLYVSVTTLAGRAMAEQKLVGLADGVFYTPLDYLFAVRRVLRTVKPLLLMVMETEIWPNLFREAKRYGCGLMVVNARISDKAFPRYRAWSWFFRPVLELPDLILAQTDTLRGRFLDAGAPAAKLRTGGNLKYDFDPGKAKAPEVIREFLEALAAEQVWIAASTMPPETPEDPDEDDVVIEAFGQLTARFPKLLLILVPRRPERFDSAARKLEKAGVTFLRRSRLAGGETLTLPGVLLLDSIGELGGVYSFADLVFMGGTLVHRGGHNILEPAFFGKAVIAGPHMENFADIAEEFTASGGLIRIATKEELSPALTRLLTSQEERDRTGARAHELAEVRRGVTGRVVEEAVALYANTPGVRRGPALLAPLSWVWEAGAARKRRRETARATRLDCRVVSVGGIAMGGVGKTPLVLWLAEELRKRGKHPAILTRGYRRRKQEKHTLLAPGEAAPPDVTGDEAQIFVRAGVGAVGIGKDRAETGQLLVERFQPDIVLLDDGFQHWRLARDVDIVLIDALDPLAGGAVFPRGRLREGPRALERADAFVITRATAGSSYDGIVSLLRRFNQSAPVFRARVTAQRWVDAATGEQSSVSGKVAAFCGLGNPAAFYKTLAELGMKPVYRWDFGDHHHYRPWELKRLVTQARQTGAEILLTTEKDMANLDDPTGRWAAPLRLAWLKISLELDEPERLLHLVTFKRQ